jgi:peroxiredoxin
LIVEVRFPLVVERASDFELPDQEGNAWGLADHIARGPVLLVFYRGDW